MTINNNYNGNISVELARYLALREAGLDAAYDFSETLEDGYYVLEFTADELHYTCYVDAKTGEVPGLTFEPVGIESYPDEAVRFPQRAVA